MEPEALPAAATAPALPSPRECREAAPGAQKQDEEDQTTEQPLPAKAEPQLPGEERLAAEEQQLQRHRHLPSEPTERARQRRVPTQPAEHGQHHGQRHAQQQRELRKHWQCPHHVLLHPPEKQAGKEAQSQHLHSESGLPKLEC